MRDKQVENRLRLVLQHELDERGWTAADLAARTDGSYEGFKKAIDGERGITPRTLAMAAEAFGTTVLALRRRAGVLTPAERRALMSRIKIEDYLRDDELLGPDDRQRVIDLYYRLAGREGPT